MTVQKSPGQVAPATVSKLEKFLHSDLFNESIQNPSRTAVCHCHYTGKRHSPSNPALTQAQAARTSGSVKLAVWDVLSPAITELYDKCLTSNDSQCI